MGTPENTNFRESTADLLLILFGTSCFAYAELPTNLLFSQIQASQTGGHLYSDISPLWRVFSGDTIAAQLMEWSFPNLSSTPFHPH